MRDFDRKVEAARKYDSETTERVCYWGEVAIIASQNLGRLIREGQKAGTIARQGKGKSTDKSNGETKCDTLSHLGIDRKHASRCKQIERIPEPVREQYVADCKSSGDATTKSGSASNPQSDGRKGLIIAAMR